MKLYKILIAIILSSYSLVATAAEGKWTKGFGQGNLEYFIDKGNTRLSIGCLSEESNNGGYVSVDFIVDSKFVKSFKIQIDGRTYHGPFNSGTRNGSNDVIGLIDDLQKTDAKVVYGANTFVFPKSNVSKILQTYKSGKLACAFN